LVKLLGGLLMVLPLGHQATLSLQITWQAQSGEWPQIGLQLLGTRTVSATRQRLGGSLPQGIAFKLTSLITLPAIRINVFRLLAVGLRTWPQTPAQTTRCWEMTVTWSSTGGMQTMGRGLRRLLVIYLMLA
jgi:hypothetical protein